MTGGMSGGNRRGLPATDFVRAPELEASPVARVFTDTEDHTLVQRRLGLVYGLFALILGGFFTLALVVSGIVLPARFWETNVSVMRLGHLIAVAGLAAAWALCLGKPRPAWLLAAIDLVGSLAVLTMVSIMIAFAPAGWRTQLMGTGLFVFVITLRAALVPSPPTWTAVVCVIAALPVPLGAYVATLHDPTWSEALFPRIAVLLIVTGWCVAGTASAYAISRIVYGLRAEVKSAMRLGQYTLEEKIGEGGMGTVYRARHALLRRPTAIKLLSPERSGAANVKRFEREVQLTSLLTHPNTIAIYDYGHTQDGAFYYVMELLDGISLHDLCEEDGPQPAGRVTFILAQAASALAEAHDAGLIHRDVKPANIMLCERGGMADFVKVLDFGLVKDMTESESTDAARSSADAIAGTPLYMAPETVTNPKEVDARVDIYALGAVGYWLLTAEPPFEGANLVEVLSHHLHSIPKTPSERLGREVPTELEALIMKCLAKTPGDRPASMHELAGALRALETRLAWSEAEAHAWWHARSSSKKLAAERLGAQLSAPLGPVARQP